MLSMTKRTGYGLIAMTHLARLPEGQVASAREIAAQYGIPLALLMNVMKELSSAGFVSSVRGAHGGYRLARRPEEVSFASLMEALEGPVRLAECVTGDLDDTDGTVTCSLMDQCPIADPVHRVHRRIMEMLSGLNLAEILDPARREP